MAFDNLFEVEGGSKKYYIYPLTKGNFYRPTNCFCVFDGDIDKLFLFLFFTSVTHNFLLRECWSSLLWLGDEYRISSPSSIDYRDLAWKFPIAPEEMETIEGYICFWRRVPYYFEESEVWYRELTRRQNKHAPMNKKRRLRGIWNKSNALL